MLQVHFEIKVYLAIPLVGLYSMEMLANVLESSEQHHPNSTEPEATQMFLFWVPHSWRHAGLYHLNGISRRCLNKFWYIHNEILYSNENEQIYIIYNVAESHQLAREWKNQKPEHYILTDDIYLNFKKQIKLTFEIIFTIIYTLGQTSDWPKGCLLVIVGVFLSEFKRWSKDVLNL